MTFKHTCDGPTPGSVRRGLWGFLKRAVFALGLLSLIASPVACSDDDGGDVADTGPINWRDFTLQIGHLDDAEAFQALDAASTMEIVVGFQGLIYIKTSLSADADIPDILTADARVSFVDRPDYDFTFRSNYVEFDPGPVPRLCRLFQVNFGQDISLLRDQTIELTITLTGDDWRSTASQRFTIVDEEDCYEAQTGELICE